MPDIFEKLFEELSKSLPNKDDRDLLKVLLEVQSKGGKDALQTYVKAMIGGLAGEDL